MLTLTCIYLFRKHVLKKSMTIHLNIPLIGKYTLK